MEYGALRIRYDENGREIWDSHHRGNMVHMTDVEIVSQVNAEIRGMYNYYSIAENAASPAQADQDNDIAIANKMNFPFI